MLSFVIVTPTLNAEKYIAETIHSVTSQDYPQQKYIIVDGGSTDRTEQVVKTAAADIDWVVADRAGQSAAINLGWQATLGDVYAWLNADDIYLPGALDTVADYFRSNPDTHIVYGDCELIDAAGKQIGRYLTQPFNYPSFIKYALNYIPQPAAFIRKSVLDAVGLLDEKLDFVMDFEFWIRAGLELKIDYLPVPLAAMRLHYESKSASKLVDFATEIIAVYQAFFSQPLPENIENLKKIALSNAYYRASDHAFWGEDFSAARNYALLGCRMAPFNLRRQLVLSMLGRQGNRLLSAIRGNPHTRSFS